MLINAFKKELETSCGCVPERLMRNFWGYKVKLFPLWIAHQWEVVNSQKKKKKLFHFEQSYVRNCMGEVKIPLFFLLLRKNTQWKQTEISVETLLSYTTSRFPETRSSANMISLSWELALFLIQSLQQLNRPRFKVKTLGASFNSWMCRPSHPPPLHLNIVPSCSHLRSFTTNSIPLNELPFPHFIRAQHDPQIGPCKFSPIWLLLSWRRPRL